MQTSPVIAAIDHVVLRVRSLEQTAQFYQDVLGCQLDRRREALGMIHLRAGNALIDLVSVDGPLGQRGGRAPAPDARNLDHLCLRVANLNLTQIQQHLHSKGVPFGDITRRYGAQGEADSLYLQDNEGNGIELRTTTSADAMPPPLLP